MKINSYGIPTILRYNPRTEEIKDIRDGVREMKKLLAEQDCYAYKPKNPTEPSNKQKKS